MRQCIARGLLAAAMVAAPGAWTQETAPPVEPATAPRLPPPRNAAVEQPRPFGYVVGDVLTQRVLLELNGRRHTPAVLPRPERISGWLERRAVRSETMPDGRRWLVVEYQVINAPRALVLARIPAWELSARSGGEVLRIAEWPVSIAALTPRSAFGQGGLGDLRADRPAPLVDIAPIRRQAVLWSGACVTTLMLWAGWLLWRNWRAAATRPFASALREIRRLGDDTPQAWQALHRAFDRTTGRVTQTATLPLLFQRAPQFAPLRPRIEEFFRQSGERFFGRGAPRHPLSVRALCVELHRVEKSHEP